MLNIAMQWIAWCSVLTFFLALCPQSYSGIMCYLAPALRGHRFHSSLAALFTALAPHLGHDAADLGFGELGLLGLLFLFFGRFLD